MFCSRCGTEVENQSKFCPSCGLDLSATTPLAAMSAERSEASEIDAVRDALKAEWEVEKELGRGGMAIVYKAHDKQLDRDVAIKILPFSLAFDKEFVERFQREARTAGKLEHPHIIPIYRVGKTGRVIYFVMKFLRGGCLSDVIEQKGPMDAAAIRRLLVETAKALSYAHKHDIVHRDIKPDNIMFDEIGHAVLTDFGIAKAATGTRLTGTGMSIGTPHYMSPEQARAQPLDGRSDIYSLGVVAYQCLTGHVPFDGEDAFAIGYKHIMEEVPVPQLDTPEQRRLFGVISHMMAKDPNERFQSADELVANLEGQTTGATAPAQAVRLSEAATTVIPTPPRGRVPTIPAGGRPTTPTTPIPQRAAERRPEPKKKRSGVLVGLLFVLFVGAGGAGGYWYFELGAKWPPFAKSGANAATGGGAQPGATSDSVTGARPNDTVTAGVPIDSVGAVPADTTQAGQAPANLPETGTLIISVNSRLVRVEVDGNQVTPGDSVRVTPGGHRITATRTGYSPYTNSVQVARGDIREVAVALERLPPPEPVGQCSDPTAGTYNRQNLCYDTPPRALDPPLVDVPQRVTRQVGRVVLWVRVGEDGQGKEIRWVQRSSNLQFDQVAARFALRNMRYEPAKKGGQVVESWLQLPLNPRQ